MFTHILVPHDTSEPADHALRYATKLAKQFGATVTLVSVVSTMPPKLPDQMIRMHWAHGEKVKAYLKSACEQLRQAGISADFHIIDNDHVAQSLVQFADDCDADLIVMGTHGRTGFNRLWLGSVADEVRHQANQPLMLIRPKEASKM